MASTCPICKENPVSICEQPASIFGINVKWVGRIEIWLWKDREQEACMDCMLERDNSVRREGMDSAYDCGFENGYNAGRKD